MNGIVQHYAAFRQRYARRIPHQVARNGRTCYGCGGGR